MSRDTDVRDPIGACQRSVIETVDDWLFFEQAGAVRTAHPQRAPRTAAAPFAGTGFGVAPDD
jgi:hypothetical protein